MMSHDNIANYSVDNSVDITSTQPSVLQIWSFCFSVFNNFLLLGTLVFVAVSWRKIKLWRQFKNYTFANLIIAQFLLNVSNIAFYSDWPCFNHVADLFYKTSLASFSNWMLICFIVIYTKMVKVFSGELRHRYLKANAFAWGLSLVEGVISTYVLCPAVITVTLAITYIAFGFYLSIVRSLSKLQAVRMVSDENSRQVMKIFLYVSSGLIILLFMQILEYVPEYYDLVFLMICVFQLVFMASFLIMPSHREMWTEHWKQNSYSKDVSQSRNLSV